MQPNCPTFVINCLPSSGREGSTSKLTYKENSGFVLRFSAGNECEMVSLGVSPIVLMSSNCS